MTTGSLTGVMGVARRQRTRRSAGGPSSRGVASLNSAGVGRWRWVSEGRQRPLVDGLESPDLHPGLQGVQPMAGVRATRRHAADRQPHVSSTVTGKVRQDFGLERNAGFGNRGGAPKLPPSGGREVATPHHGGRRDAVTTMRLPSVFVPRRPLAMRPMPVHAHYCDGCDQAWPHEGFTCLQHGAWQCSRCPG